VLVFARGLAAVLAVALVVDEAVAFLLTAMFHPGNHLLFLHVPSFDFVGNPLADTCHFRVLHRLFDELGSIEVPAHDEDLVFARTALAFAAVDQVFFGACALVLRRDSDARDRGNLGLALDHPFRESDDRRLLFAHELQAKRSPQGGGQGLGTTAKAERDAVGRERNLRVHAFSCVKVRCCGDFCLILRPSTFNVYYTRN
jgi:hypothetical protein